MPITPFQYQQMLARTSAVKRVNAEIAASTEPVIQSESDLHDQIIEECKNRGWLYVHSRMDKPTTTACGVTDFIIATTDGRTLWIECKREGVKLTPEQRATIHWLERNRQLVGVVYSFQNFLGIADRKVP
jgi:hypothetical protein